MSHHSLQTVPLSMDTSKEIRRTEIEIQLLRREFEKYFVGANDLPPRALETKVLAAIKRLKEGTRSQADIFRVNSLEARFSSYREMYHRKLRDREEGRSRRPVQSPQSTGPDAKSGIRVTGTVSEQAALSLYKGLYGDRDAPAVGLPQFRNYLQQQVSQIQQRTGCSDIVFRLAVDKGKPRLRAKPVRRDSQS